MTVLTINDKSQFELGDIVQIVGGKYRHCIVPLVEITPLGEIYVLIGQQRVRLLKPATIVLKRKKV